MEREKEDQKEGKFYESMLYGAAPVGFYLDARYLRSAFFFSIFFFNGSGALHGVAGTRLR